MRNSYARKLAIVLALACCFFVGAPAFAQSAPFGYLDLATGADTSTNIPNSGSLYVWGWAGDYQDFAPVARVQIFIDGVFVTNATLGVSRPDVANVFGPAYAKSGYSAIIPLSKYAAGPHQVIAYATNSAGLTAMLITDKTFVVLAPNVGVSSVSVTGTLAAGTTVQATEVTTNTGSYQAPASYTRFYLNKTAVKGGFQLGGQFIPALAINASSTPQTTNVVLPANVSGQYYFLACANDNGAVLDRYAENDCASTQINVDGPDLAQSLSVATQTAIAGGTLQLTDTVRNVGAGAAGNSLTRFYLNTTAVKGGYQIGGGRQIPSLAPNAVSGPVTSTVTLPNNISGSYFVIACANDVAGVPDTNTSNNCVSSPITMSGPDLAESMSFSPSALTAGSTVQITDTVTNVGLGTASNSLTRYYLNTTATRGGYLLGSGRQVLTLAPGASSGPVTTKVTLPNIGGDYFIVACANDVNSFVENTVNNCVTAPVSLYTGSATVIVNPAAAAATYDPATCGTATAACKTISDGVAVAKAGQTVLVSPGTYVEQVIISKNITLVSAGKQQAILKAPADTKLAADADGHQTLLTITGGATSVSVKDMTIAGPMFADSCSDNIYGVYVKNANATITGNKIDAIRQSNPALWGCQPGVGIRFGSRALGYVGHTGTISSNTIAGPAKGGIVVDGDNTNVNVTGNTVTGLNVLSVVGQNGIQISRGARGTLDSNNVSGFRYGDTFSNLSAAGILVYDVAGNVTVTKNIVSGNDEGIGVYHSPAHLADGTTVDYNTQFTVGATIKNNQVNNNAYLGIHIDPFSKGSTIWNNTVTGNNGGWDELDEHPDFNSNDWGSDPSQYNTVVSVHSGLVFTY